MLALHNITAPPRCPERSASASVHSNRNRLVRHPRGAGCYAGSLVGFLCDFPSNRMNGAVRRVPMVLKQQQRCYKIIPTERGGISRIAHKQPIGVSSLVNSNNHHTIDRVSGI
jgi:hypothetical protein